MKELRNPFCWTHPTPPKPRTIPVGSTVRRRLFADEEPSEPTGNPNIINSADDVNRMLREEEARAAKRYSFGIMKEPGPNSVWSCLCPGIPRDGNRKRKIQAIQEHNENIRTKTYKVLEDPYLYYIESIAVLDNLANSLMDDTQDCYAESVQHWNFDFDNQMPSEGLAVWQQVGRHWVGNEKGIHTRLVLYPTEDEIEENTSITHEEPNKALSKGRAEDPSTALKPTDKIDHLFTEYVNVIYGDWKKEMRTGIRTVTMKSTRQNLDTDLIEGIRLLQATNEHRQVSRAEAIAMIRDENPNQQNKATVDKANDNSDDISEVNNSTPKKNLRFIREE